MSETLLETPGLKVGTFCGPDTIPAFYGGKTRLCVNIEDDRGRYVEIPLVLIPTLIETLEPVLKAEADCLRKEPKK